MPTAPGSWAQPHRRHPRLGHLLGEVGEDERPLLRHQLVLLHPEFLQQLPAGDGEDGLEEAAPEDVSGLVAGEAVAALRHVAVAQPPGGDRRASASLLGWLHEPSLGSRDPRGSWPTLFGSTTSGFQLWESWGEAEDARCPPSACPHPSPGVVDLVGGHVVVLRALPELGRRLQLPVVEAEQEHLGELVHGLPLLGGQVAELVLHEVQDSLGERKGGWWMGTGGVKTTGTGTLESSGLGQPLPGTCKFGEKGRKSRSRVGHCWPSPHCSVRPTPGTPTLSSCPLLGSERRAGARVCTTKQKALLFAQPGEQAGAENHRAGWGKEQQPLGATSHRGCKRRDHREQCGMRTRHRHGSRASPARCWVSQKGGSPATPRPPAGSSAGCTS